jgi:hypothetical protein
MNSTTHNVHRLALAALAALAALTLAGCASGPQPLYHWGSYQEQIYGHFKGEKGPEEQIQSLEKDAEHAAAKNRPLPPGFQAHLAMLYGESGRPDKMASYLDEEKRHFPESATFMDFLLQKFKK